MSCLNIASAQVRSVWGYNLEEEFTLIRQIAKWYPYVAIDTEFPGVVYEATTHPRDLSPEQRYALMKQNVDSLKLLQLGLTLSSSDGSDRSVIVWEFNFRGFHPLQDLRALSSIQLLESQGLNLWANYYYGVDPQRFSYLLKSSGLLGMKSKIWIGFHTAYDFAYLVKVLIQTELPDSMAVFMELVQWYFGFSIYDIKHLCKSCNGLYGGLERVAGMLKVQRTGGLSHNAGSDSLLIWDTFTTMKQVFFTGGIEAKHARVLFGIQDI